MGGGGEEGAQLIYGFVARGTMVLAEYTEFTGNFPAIAGQCLQKLPSSNNRLTYSCDHHTFNFLVHDGYDLAVEEVLDKQGFLLDLRNLGTTTGRAFNVGAVQTNLPRDFTVGEVIYAAAYCVVAKDAVGKQVSLAFLERLKEDFKKRYGGGKADTALAKSLNKEFGPIIKEHMQYVIDHVDEIEKILNVKAQVSEVKNIMLENIEKTVDRGENIKDLADKTVDLHSQAQEFKKQGTRVRRKMWFQNMKIKLVVLAILLFLVLIIWVSVCQGFDCTK